MTHTPTPNCTGTVRWFSRARGYGFIDSPDLPGLDIYAHFSDIEGDGYRNLYEGERVRFDAVENVRDGRYKGMKAVNIKCLQSYQP